ncbi:MAG: hypothetical protein ASARMPRED_007375 [Alectoria sarmentosa]|nr:MAG: hypothetical protein ASARMPRED_007375 [Alectoria sarmentosa]
MSVLLMFFTLSTSVLADEDSKKKIPAAYALIPTYVKAAIFWSMFITWASWRISRIWGSGKVHAPSPRPHYLWTPLGWVDEQTWELTQAKLARRKEAKRDKHKFYRTTKANYKWIFHDPIGELQKRFDDKKMRSCLHLLPSWTRSYSHGTKQLGLFAELGKAPEGIYESLELHFSTNSRLSLSGPLEHAQLDGYPMSGTLRNPHRLLDIPIMEFLNAMLPSAPKKSYLLPKLPMMDEPNVIQVWHVRERPLPERMGRPRLESEQELSGEVELQETMIRRDTRYRLREGRPRRLELMNESDPDYESEAETLTIPLRNPVAFSRRQAGDRPYPEVGSSPMRRQRDVENLGGRIQEVRTDPALTLVHGMLEIMMRELGQARGGRHRRAPIASQSPILIPDPPLPEVVRHANRLRSHIEGLERRIHDLRTEPSLDPVRGALDSLMHDLRGARAERDRLGPISSLHAVVPNAQGQLQNNQTHQLPTPIQNTAVGFEPIRGRPRAMHEMGRFGLTVQVPNTVEIMNLSDRLHRLAGRNLRNQLQDLRTLPQAIEVLAHLINQRLLQNIRNVNTSTPTIVTPQIHRGANRVEIEGPALDDSISSDPISAGGVHGGNRAVIEGPITDDTPRPNSNSEEAIQPEIQHPIAAALLCSVPEHDANLNQIDSAAQRRLEHENTLRAEATRQTAAFYDEMGRSDPATNVYVQEIQTDDDATPINTLHSPTSTPAAPALPTATATQATTTATLSSRELEDGLNEELYTDAHP